MAIPENITHEDILQALQEIDDKGIPTNRDPQGYFQSHTEKTYLANCIIEDKVKY